MKTYINSHAASLSLSLISILIVCFLDDHLGEIEGLNEITLEQTSKLAANWIPCVLLLSALCGIYWRLTLIQLITFYTQVFLIAFMAVDQWQQIREFEAMGMFSGEMMEMIHLNMNVKCLASLFVIGTLLATYILFRMMKGQKK